MIPMPLNIRSPANRRTAIIVLFGRPVPRVCIGKGTILPHIRQVADFCEDFVPQFGQNEYGIFRLRDVLRDNISEVINLRMYTLLLTCYLSTDRFVTAFC